jgi:hypothetical protein
VAGRKSNGNIKPARFVKEDTTTPGTVLQATDGSASHGDKPFGVSGSSQRFAPYGPLQDGYHAIQNENCTVYQPGMPPPDGDNIMLTVGAAVTVDDDLKSDSDGRAITAASTGDWVGATALDTATAAGQQIPVKLVYPRTRT